MVEERFAGVNGAGNKPSLLPKFSSLDDPIPFVEMFFKEYPLAAEQLLVVEDRAYFLAISNRDRDRNLFLSFLSWTRALKCKGTSVSM